MRADAAPCRPDRWRATHHIFTTARAEQPPRPPPPVDGGAAGNPSRTVCRKIAPYGGRLARYPEDRRSLPTLGPVLSSRPHEVHARRRRGNIASDAIGSSRKVFFYSGKGNNSR